MDAAGPFSVFNFPPLDSTLSQMNLVYLLQPWLLKIHCNINFVLALRSLPFRFFDQNYVCMFLFPVPCYLSLCLFTYKYRKVSISEVTVYLQHL